MRFVFCVIVAVVLFPKSMFSAPARPSLAYTFQRDHDLVITVVVRYNSGKPEGEVGAMQFSSGAQKITPFRMTHDQFEKIWSSFVSSGIDQHPIEQVRHTIDLDFYYVFLIGGRKYALLKRKASPALVALAQRMQACAMPNMLALPGERKSAPSSDTERVIIH
jgi:hypothetical protein